MGTIADKLTRIITTKEDIRQALISKGYDVPTSIPFKEYAKMILDLPCKVDDFPELPGDVTRWHFGGLTNEMMAAMDDPRIEDADGKGRFLSFKNFAWGGMSGAGGVSTYYDKYEFTPDKYYMVAVSSGTQHAQFTFKVTGLVDGNTLSLADTSSPSNLYGKWTQDGIYTVDIDVINTDKSIYFYNGVSAIRGTFTIEILPIYPGALVFDGVDDYGVCDNFPILTKEKGYTVVALRQWISMGEGISGLVSNVKNWFNDGAFVLEYNSNNATNKFVNKPVSFGNVNIEMDLPNNFTYQTSKSYKGVPITTGSFKGTNSLFVGKLNNIIGNCSNVAIWELVFLDHDATEEELTKIKDYFVKTYPWLFPDQAWTVVGKTNEDEDRATIANITGNGNDLVLSNFGFAEGSGYGLYAYNFNSFSLRDNVVKPTDVKKDSFRMIGTGNSNNVLILLNESDSADWKIRITGMKEGDRCLIGNANKSGEYISVNKDGTYTFQKQYAATSTNGIWYNSSQEVDVLIEQIPEYEGYLVTDGVDDEIVSAKLIQFADKFTIVGDWKFMEDRNDNAGLLKANQIYIYNATTGMRIYLKQGSKNYPFSCKKINALTSDGWVYDEKWDKYKVYPIGSDIDISSRLFLGFYGSNFTKIALKNLGIYNDQLLSKDDCIKAYNYLQTLKSK